MAKTSLLLVALVLLGSALAVGVSAAPLQVQAPAVASAPLPAATAQALFPAPGQTEICPLCIIGYHCCITPSGQAGCFPASRPCP